MTQLLRTVTTSQLGCIMDCNLATGAKIGGGTATDNTVLINAFLATASAGNPIKLIIDGGTLASGIQIAQAGYTTIEGLGWQTGIFVNFGANADAINNYPTNQTIPINAGPPPPSRTGQNVIIRNLFINGNRGNGTTGNSTTGDPRGTNGVTWYMGISLVNLNHITLENIWFYDIATYGMLLSNVGDVVISGCRVEAPSLAFNTDGVHFNGTSNDIRISQCYFNTGDDSIALNCPEGYSGNISRVCIDSCVCANGNSLMRIYTSDGVTNSLVDSVVLTNCIAVVQASGTAFIIGTGQGAGSSNSIRSLLVSNCDITAPIFANVSNNTEYLEFNQITFSPSGTTTGIALSGGATVSTLKVNGMSVTGTVGYLVESPSGCTLSALLIDALDGRSLTALVGSSGFTNITGIGGSALKSTAFEIPNANMLNDCDYMSSTSHLPSIKISGTVKTYTVT